MLLKSDTNFLKGLQDFCDLYTITVIDYFMICLFSDIQDFYENTLVNERVSFDDKTRETRRLAERWENNPPFGAFGGYTTSTSLFDKPLTNGYHATDGHNVSSHSYTFQEQRKELVSTFIRSDVFVYFCVYPYFSLIGNSSD